MSAKLLDPQMLHKILRYDRETGKLYWRTRSKDTFTNPRRSESWNSHYAGKIALNTNTQGYRAGTINSRPVLAHRAIWALEYGEWPDGQIDHVNGDRADNRVENLRLVSHAENQQNQRLPSNNKSGRIGVHFHKKRRKWVAVIGVNGKQTQIGHFRELGEAIAAREKAEVQYGYHSNHGRKVA